MTLHSNGTLTLALIGLASCASSSRTEPDAQRDLAHDQFPEAQAAIRAEMLALDDTVNRGDWDGLRSAHLSGPKFSKLKVGHGRQDFDEMIADELSALSTVENFSIEWREDDCNILIVGTREHTKMLYLYIPEFPMVPVTGFVSYDDMPGERLHARMAEQSSGAEDYSHGRITFQRVLQRPELFVNGSIIDSASLFVTNRQTQRAAATVLIDELETLPKLGIGREVGEESRVGIESKETYSEDQGYRGYHR